MTTQGQIIGCNNASYLLSSANVSLQAIIKSELTVVARLQSAISDVRQILGASDKLDNLTHLLTQINPLGTTAMGVLEQIQESITYIQSVSTSLSDPADTTPDPIPL